MIERETQCGKRSIVSVKEMFQSGKKLSLNSREVCLDVGAKRTGISWCRLATTSMPSVERGYGARIMKSHDLGAVR